MRLNHSEQVYMTKVSSLNGHKFFTRQLLDVITLPVNDNTGEYAVVQNTTFSVLKAAGIDNIDYDAVEEIEWLMHDESSLEDRKNMKLGDLIVIYQEIKKS